MARYDPAVSCTGKVPHATRDAAVRAAVSLMRKHRDRGLQAYHCRLCGAFHIGHAKGMGPGRRRTGASS